MTKATKQTTKQKKTERIDDVTASPGATAGLARYCCEFAATVSMNRVSQKGVFRYTDNFAVPTAAVGTLFTLRDAPGKPGVFFCGNTKRRPQAPLSCLAEPTAA